MKKKDWKREDISDRKLWRKTSPVATDPKTNWYLPLTSIKVKQEGTFGYY